MTREEKVIYPIVGAAAVLGIWAALRGGKTPSQVFGGSVSIPPLPATQQRFFGPANQPGETIPDDSVSITDKGPGANRGSDGSYVMLSANNPLSANPRDPRTLRPMSYLTYNLPPWSDWAKFNGLQQVPEQLNTKPKDTTGCCGPGGVSCDMKLAPRFPDGRGACLTFKPKIENLTDERNISMFLSASQYNCSNIYAPFDLNCTEVAGYPPADQLVPQVSRYWGGDAQLEGQY